MSEFIQSKFLEYCVNSKITFYVDEYHYSPAHKHDFFEISYVTKGKTSHTMNNHTQEIKEGDFFIIDYDTIHSYCHPEGDDFQIINILFVPDFIDNILMGCKKFNDILKHYLLKINYISTDKIPANVIYHDNDGKYRNMMMKMKKEFDLKKPGYLELLRSYLIELIIKITRLTIKNNADLIHESPSKYIAEYVDLNYMHNPSLSAFCKQFNYSLSTISKEFKKTMGVSFSRYLQQSRIEHACRLFANTDKKIYEVALLVGYNDIKSFTKTFKELVGCTPNEYKKKFTF